MEMNEAPLAEVVNVAVAAVIGVQTRERGGGTRLKINSKSKSEKISRG